MGPAMSDRTVEAHACAFDERDMEAISCRGSR